MAGQDRAAHSKTLKSCDACKARKVRCSGYPDPCANCTRRNTKCIFRPARAPRRRGKAANNPLSGVYRLSSPEAVPPAVFIPNSDHVLSGLNPQCNPSFNLYIDLLLTRPPSSSRPDQCRTSPYKGNGIFADSLSLTFFSESRLLSLSSHLKNNRVNEVVRKGAAIISHRAKPLTQVSAVSTLEKTKCAEEPDGKTSASLYIRYYFEHVHPLFPFLDRNSFEAAAVSPNLTQSLSRNKAWSALYHSILALGCQYDNGGSFEPGSGRSWKLFSVSLAMFPELILLPDSVTTLEAMAAMSIYTLSICCLRIERIIVSEAARKAQDFWHSRPSMAVAQASRRVFWVIYCVEKLTSFYTGRSSVFIDSDVGCPVPHVPQTILDGFDWFLTFAQYTRLLSKTYTSLFAIGVSENPTNYFLTSIDRLLSELDRWREPIPEHINPAQQFHVHTMPNLLTRTIAIWVRLFYYGLLLILTRARLHLESKIEDVTGSLRHQDTMERMLEASRLILELTKFIDVEPYTPFWIVAGIPVAALFVLFDIVIHHPSHPQTRSNLAILDVAGGHFSRLEYASGGSLPGSLITEFASIAREHVNTTETRHRPDGPPEKSEQDHPVSGAATINSLSAVVDARTSARDTALGPPLASSPLAVVANTALPGQRSAMSQREVDDGISMRRPAAEGVDAFPFPNYDNPEYIYQDSILETGTEIMDLFGSSLPGIDPILWPWLANSSQ